MATKLSMGRGASGAWRELELQNLELRAANQVLQRRNEELAAVGDRFRALYERAPTPFVTVDVTHTIVDVNPAAEQLLAATADQLIGQSLDGFIEQTGRAKFRGFVDAVFATMTHERCDDVVVVRGGQVPVIALVDGVLLPVPPTDAPRCVLTIVDVTARSMSEAMRRRAQDDAVAMVSHDLRGPLNAIGLACGGLAMGLSTSPRDKYISAIERSTERCRRLVDDLMRIAQIEGGRLELEVSSFDARDLLQQTFRDHELAAAAAGSPISIQLPRTAVPTSGDRERLHRAVSNLVQNALVHARGAAIELSLDLRETLVVISVADHGPGIPPDELPLVFEKYRRGAHRHGGLGLGLAIVKGLVEAHRGSVAVASQLGHGARFEISLPSATSSDATLV